MTRTTIGALTVALGLSFAPAALAQSVHLERVPGVFRDLARSPGSLTLPLEGDEEGLLVSIGFSFSYYGQNFTQLGVTTNGYVTVGTAVGPDNDSLPSAALPNGVLAPFWDDLDTRPNPDARIYMERVGAPGARVLTIQWSGLALKADPAARLTFQVLIFEGTNEVLFHYGPMKNGDGSEGTGGASGASATIGVESPDGSAAVPVAFDQVGVARPGLGYAFLPRTGAPLPEARKLGDLDGDGRVTVLDQSRQVELTSARYRPASALELVAADVAPLDSQGAVWGDGTLRVSDRDLISQVIVERVTLAPYLSDLLPGAVAPLSTLTVIGSGFDVSSAGNNVVVLPRAGGGTLEVAAATVNATGSRITLSLPQDARRGVSYVKVGTRRTNERTLSVAGVPAILAIAPAPAVIGETLAIGGLEFPANTADVQVTIGGLTATVLTITAGPDTGFGVTRIVSVTIPAELSPGQHPVVVATGMRVSEPVPHTFGDLPIVAITAPTDDAVITDRFTVTGTVQDADLARYELAYAPLEGGEWVTFFTGMTQVASGDLGAFDPTLLLNGYYRLRLKAIDVHGLSAADEVIASVQGLVKLGHFSIAFTDVEVPVAGIAIRVQRGYDSRFKKVGDFGHGWRLGLVSVDLSEDGAHNVTLDNPLSDRVEFKFEPVSHGFPNVFFDATYVSTGLAERSQIDFETPEGVFEGNHVIAKDGVGNWFWFPDGIPFDPVVYRLTQQDGTVLRVHDEDDLLQVIKPDGVTLTVTREGILHSSGKSVTFARDALERIVSVTDPNGGAHAYEYDVAGDLVRHTDRDGHATTFTYRSDHHMIDWIDPRGVRVRKNEYDDAGRLVAIVDALGRRVEFTHDLDARRQISEDRRGGLTITEYDERGLVTALTTPDQKTETYTHDDRGNLLTRVDRKGKTWTYTYDAQNNQDSQTDPLGNTISYTYDAQGRILTITDADGGVFTYVYDADGHLLRTIDQEGGETVRTVNAQGQVTSLTDPSGRVTEWGYDEAGFPTRRKDPSGRVTLFENDANGNCVGEVEIVPVPGGPSVRLATTHEFTASNRPTKSTHPDGSFRTWTYGPVGQVAETNDSEGRRVNYEYDELNYLTARYFADGTVERQEYDPQGQLTAITTARGTKRCDVDLRNFVTRIELPDGTEQHLEHDAQGNLTSRTDGRGHTWLFEYDDAGRLVREIDPEGGVTTTTRNDKGDVIARRDPDGKTTTFDRDRTGRHIATTHPDGRVSRVTPDDAANTTLVEDRYGRTTRYEFSPTGASTQIVLPSGTASITYDARGNVLSRTDVNRHTTSFRYDPVSGQRVARRLPMGEEATVEYDSLTGSPIAFVGFDGQRVEVEYDAYGRISYRGFPDQSSETISYDDLGRVREVSDARGSTAFGHDRLGRLTARRDPEGALTEWSYDAGGNVEKVTTPAGAFVSAYDLAGRLTSVTSVTSETITLAHTPGGRLREIARPNGVSSQLTYDVAGRLERVAHTGPNGPIAGYTYSYSPEGRRSRVVEDSGRTASWAYDLMGRLTTEAVAIAPIGTVTYAYTYDPAGNRTSKTTTRPDGSTESITYTYDLNDRLLREDIVDSLGPSQGPVVYTHDASGYLRSRTSPAGSATYDYDAVGRLSSATVVQLGGTTSHVEYRYDHEGRRVETVTDGVITRHVVDPVRPFWQRLVDVDEHGQVLASYPCAVQPLARTDGAGRTFYLLQDGQTSVRLVVDGTGAVVATRDYDAFGLPLGDSGDPELVSVAYAGEHLDPTTGLYDLRSRWLDPRTGRFLTRDTFEGFPLDPATAHPYAYANQNPIEFIDPPGTFALSIGMAIMLVELTYLFRELQAMEVIHEARRGQALLKDTMASLFSEPNALDLLAMDATYALNYAQATRLVDPSFTNGHPGAPRNEVASTALFGTKTSIRHGSDLVLGSSRGPEGDTRPPAQRLSEDGALHAGVSLFGISTSGGPGCAPTDDVEESAVGRQVLEWLRTQSSVKDVMVAEQQTDAHGNQVGNNYVDIQFTVTPTLTRWYVDVTRTTVSFTDTGVERRTGSISQVERLLRNDPRGIALELEQSATLRDFQEALRNDTQSLAQEQRFVPPPGAVATKVETRVYRNLPAEPLYDVPMAGNGIVPATGEFVLARTDLRVPGPGPAFELSRVYRSGVQFPDTSIFPLGPGWFLTYDERISGIPGGRDRTELDTYGRLAAVHRTDSKDKRKLATRPIGVYANLIASIVGYLKFGNDGVVGRVASPGYVRRDADGMVRKYDDGGWLVEIADRNQNTLFLIRDVNHRLRRVLDTAGRTYDYEYVQRTSPGGVVHDLLSTVRDVVGQRVVRYEYDTNLDLVSVTSASGREERYAYSAGYLSPVLNHNMIAVWSPAGVAEGHGPVIENVYGDGGDGPDRTLDPSFDKVTRQRLGGETFVRFANGDGAIVPAGGTTRLEYDDPLGSLPVDLLDPNAPIRKTTVVDRGGNTVVYHFNKLGSAVLIVDEKAALTFHRYNRDGRRAYTEHATGQREYLFYDDRAINPTSQGTLVARMVFPRSGQRETRAIVTLNVYEPFANQVLRTTETRGFLPITEPPPEGTDVVGWLLGKAGPEFDAYTTITTYDYQEGTAPLPAAELFGVRFDGVVRDLGDQNGDLLEDEPENLHGNPVRVRGHLITTASGSVHIPVVTSRFNAAGQVVLTIDALGNETTYEYLEESGKRGWLFRVTRPEGVVTETEHDARGYPRKLTDGRQTVTELEHSVDGALEKFVQDVGGIARTTTNAYDDSGRLLQTTVSGVGTDSTTQRFAYDALDDVLEEATQLDDSTWLAVRHEYDERQLRTRSVFPEEEAVAWEHDERGFVLVETLGKATLDGVSPDSVTRRKYDQTGRLIEFTDGTNDVTTYEHDGFNRLLRTVLPEQVEELRDYDAAGNLVLVERTGPRTLGPPELLERTRYDLDQADRVIRTRREHLETGEEAATTLEYDVLGRLEVAQTHDGHRTLMSHDDLGRVTRVVDPLGNAVERVLDANGNVLVRREVETSGLDTPETFTTTATYDKLDRLESSVDDLGQTVRLSYDARDNLTRVVDPRGNVTRHEFDRANRQVRTTLELRDGGEGAGALASTTHNADSLITTERTFDENDRVTSIRDDRGNLTRYRYDALGRVDLVTCADNTTWSYTYDGDSNLRLTTDPNGSQVLRTYDALDRLERVEVQPGAGVVGTRLQEFEWDGLSRLVRATDDNGSSLSEPGAVPSDLRREYDSLSRMTRESQDVQQVGCEYRLDDTRSRCTYPSGRQLEFTHDALDRLLTVNQIPPGAAALAAVAAYAYAGPSRLGERTSGNGFVLAPTYDPVRRPTTLRHERGGASLFAWRYGYDRSSNRTLEARDHEGGLEDQHSYDSASRLIETLFDRPPANGGGGPAPLPHVSRGFDRRSYGLDGASNRAVVEATPSGTTTPITTGYVADETNAYTRVGAAVLQDDRNGNLTDDGAGRRFGYDAFNRLVTVETATAHTRYSYDASGRRTRSDVTPIGGGPTVSTLFFYDGLRCIEERVVGGPRNGERREMVHGGRLDELVFSSATLGATTRTYYHHEDVAGNTVALTDASGVLVDEVAYDEWGSSFYRDASAHAAAGNGYLFQGHRLDEESGLYYLRARHYDPALGRFLQRDPTGVWGDPLNLGNPYTFAGNNPVTQGDPLGLVTQVQLGAGYTSAEAELRDIATARAAHTSTWAYQLGLTFSDPGFMRGIGREKELAGDLEGFASAVDSAANSWQMQVGFMALLLSPAGKVAYYTYALHELVHTGNPWPVIGSLVLGGAFRMSGSASPLLSLGLSEVDQVADDLPVAARLMLGYENCFLAGTQVAMADGTRKAIEEVDSGEEVLAGDPVRGWEGAGKVGQRFRNYTDHVAYVTFAEVRHQRGRGEAHRVGVERSGEEDGEPPPESEIALALQQTIRCTPAHPWWVEEEGDYVPAGWLRSGDRLRLEGGGEGVVVSVEVRAERAETFNFEVLGWHTYFVAAQSARGPAVLVHNPSDPTEAMIRRSGPPPVITISMSAAGKPMAGSRETGIQRAWALEVELVKKTGSGTAPWTKAEIARIKAGAGFRDLGYTGHHINRVHDAKRWRGDPRNIAFLKQGSGESHMTAGHPGGTRAKQPRGSLIDRQAMLDAARPRPRRVGGRR